MNFDHPYVLVVSVRLASCLIDQAKSAEAKEMLEAVIGQSSKIFGERHRWQGWTHFEMGRCVDLLGDPEKAQEHLDTAASILEAAVLPQHPYRRKLTAYLRGRESTDAKSASAAASATEIPT